VLLSVYYRKRIGKKLLEIPMLAAHNLNGSLLPAYRGTGPENWEVEKGEEKTGVTLHFMVEKPDAGDIVGQKVVVIEFHDTDRTLYDKLCEAADGLLEDLLPVIKTGQIPHKKQNLSDGSYYGGRRPEDGRIDWTRPARVIYNLIRAVTDPYPGAFAITENGNRMIIWRALPVEKRDMNGQAGDTDSSGEDVLVKTGENAIKLQEI